MKFKGELLIVLTSVCFSLMPVFAKSAYKVGASVTTVLLFRFIFSVIFIWGYIFIKGYKFKIKPKQIIMLAIVGGLFYSGSSISLFNSYRHISVGLSEVLMFTYPAWVLIISFLFFREKLQANKIYAIVLSIIGISAVAYAPGQKYSFIGVILALAGALCYALYAIFVDHGGFEDVHSVVMTGYLMIFAAISFSIFGLTTGEINLSFSVSGWINIILLSIISTSIPVFAFCAGARIIGASKAAIVSTIEPITTFICGYVFLGEPITFSMAIGGAIVIMAILSIHIFRTEEVISSQQSA